MSPLPVRLGLAFTLTLVLAPGPRAQCQLAQLETFDASPANPLTLSTVAPFELPELGGTLQIVSPDSPAGFFDLLFLGFVPCELPLTAPVQGALLICDPVPVGSLQLDADWSIPIAAGLPAGAVVSFQSVATDGAAVLLSNGLRATLGVLAADVEVLGVEQPATQLSGSSATYQVTLRNNGNVAVTAPVTVCVGTSCAPVFVDLDPGETAVGEAAVFLPLFPSCGETAEFPLTACSNLVLDCDPSNDCFSAPATLDPSYWDLRFEVVNAPNSVSIGQTVNWTVRVTNVGTQTSNSVCFENAIVDNGSPWVFAPAVCGNVQTDSTGFIPPGESENFFFSQFICPGSTVGQQWIKTGVMSQCSDVCGAGNYDDDTIQVQF